MLARPGVPARHRDDERDHSLIAGLIESGHAYAMTATSTSTCRPTPATAGLTATCKTCSRARFGSTSAEAPGRLCALEGLQARRAIQAQPLERWPPGWHIECSTMNLKHLGEQIDILAATTWSSRTESADQPDRPPFLSGYTTASQITPAPRTAASRSKKCRSRSAMS